MKYLLICIFFLLGCAPSIKQFRADSDIVKHKHLRHYAEILLQYKYKTGKYPFTKKGDPAQNFVFVANTAQQKHALDPAFAITRIPLKEFFEEIEKTLLKPIREYYDPQYEYLGRPNFYVYNTQDTSFYLTMHLYTKYPYADTVKEGGYKIVLSNNKDGAIKTIHPREILNDRAFLHESGRITSRHRFFKDRDKKYIRHSRKK